MHASVLHFIADQVETRHLSRRSVLEVGSLDVNGSARQFFTGRYIGTDMREGPGVDVVVNAHDLTRTLEPGSFDVVVCTEMLEHDDAPWRSLEEMREMVRPGGTLLLTARGYDRRGCFPLHGYPEDLWRFSVDGMRALLVWANWSVDMVTADPDEPGVFAVAHA